MKDKEEKEASLRKENEYENQAYTEEDVKRVWQQFLDHLKEKARDTEYATVNQQWRLEDGIIVLTLSNALQEVIIQNVKTEMMEFMRPEIKNKELDLRWEVDQKSAPKKAYTKREKFDLLAEKYPDLLDLRNRMDLDLDG